MKVLVCGSRASKDRLRVFWELAKIDERRKITRVAHGGALGTDTFADEWAEANCVPRALHGTRWAAWCNAWESDLVVAFPGGGGTRDVVEHALGRRVPVRLVDLDRKR